MIRIGRAVRTGALAVGMLAVVALGGCGGGSDKAGVASLSGKSSDTRTTTKKKKPSEAETQAAFQKFAQCMRAHGIDMPDPKVSGGKGMITIGGSGGPQNQQQIDAAQKACQHFLADVVQGQGRDVDPKQEAKMRAQALKFAKCMRDHGVNMPDPQFQSGGRVSQKLDANPNDPRFQAAQKECQKLAPNPIGGGVKGGPSNGSSTGGDFSVSGGGK